MDGALCCFFRVCKPFDLYPKTGRTRAANRDEKALEVPWEPSSGYVAGLL